jgi:hypothetical protein
MNKRNKAKRRRVSTVSRSFRAGIVLAAALLTAGVVTAIARHESASSAGPRSAAATGAGKNLVTVEVAGRKLQVDARTLQQGPLTQDQAQEIADALKDNKSTDGLVQIRQANGSLSMDLHGRFQDVVIARKNDDGSVSQACVDNPNAASAFLNNQQVPTAPSIPGGARKAPVEIQ